MDANKAKAEALAAHPEGRVPAWATNFLPSLRTDGQLWLTSELDGAVVAVQPKAWAGMRFTGEIAAKPDAGILFAQGVNLPAMQARAGEIQTNDPAFGGDLLGASTECRRDQEATAFDVKPYLPLIAAAVVSASIVLGALIVAVLLRRRSS